MTFEDLYAAKLRESAKASNARLKTGGWQPSVAQGVIGEKSRMILRLARDRGDAGLPINTQLADAIGVKVQSLHNEICRLTIRHYATVAHRRNTDHPRILHITEHGIGLIEGEADQ